MNEVKQIRMIQLAASLLLRLNEHIGISQANSTLYDLVIETPVDKAVCLVRVVDDEILNSEDFESYMRYLQNTRPFDDLAGHPLGLLKLNEAELSLEFQLIGWDDWGEYSIADRIEFYPLSQECIKLMIDEIRKHNHVVKLLDPDKMMVVKHIKLTEDIYGHKVPAEIVYLRDFKEDYKMNRVEPVNEEEVREKRQNVHLQREYPEDILDEAILKAVQTRHPEAEPWNTLLATSTEYRKWAGVKRMYKQQEAEIRILPDLGGMPIDVLARMGRIEGLRFRLDIYFMPSFERNLYDNEGYELKQPLNGWVDTLNRYTDVLKTLHRINDLV